MDSQRIIAFLLRAAGTLSNFARDRFKRSFNVPRDIRRSWKETLTLANKIEMLEIEIEIVET